MTIKTLEDCTPAELRQHAQINIGLDVPASANRATIIAKLKAANPAIVSIDVPDEPAPSPMLAEFAQVAAMHAQTPPALAPAVLHVGGSMPHYNQDPKVRLEIMKTSDPQRAKEVTLGVNGDTFRMKRGEQIDVPYRVYLVLLDAKENQSVETGEINAMGAPVREWQEVQSYPFQVHAMPTAAEIAAWHAATDNAVSSPYAARKAA